MKELIIIGARGFGREVFNVAHHCIGYDVDFKIKGFLDDKTNVLDNFIGYPPILSSVEDYKIEENDIFICALGDVFFKKKYVDIILEKGGEFINLVHKTAIVERNSKLGTGCIVCANVVISCDIEVGNFVTFQPFVVVGHDAKIGNYCHLNTYAFMGGGAVLEDLVTLHTKAVVLPKVTVEMEAVVGASSVVIKKVKKATTVTGNPAVKLKF